MQKIVKALGDWLGRRLEDEERQINRWKRIVRRLRGKLVK